MLFLQGWAFLITVGRETINCGPLPRSSLRRNPSRWTHVVRKFDNFWLSFSPINRHPDIGIWQVAPLMTSLGLGEWYGMEIPMFSCLQIVKSKWIWAQQSLVKFLLTFRGYRIKWIYESVHQITQYFWAVVFYNS